MTKVVAFEGNMLPGTMGRRAPCFESEDGLWFFVNPDDPRKQHQIPRDTSEGITRITPIIRVPTGVVLFATKRFFDPFSLEVSTQVQDMLTWDATAEAYIYYAAKEEVVTLQVNKIGVMLLEEVKRQSADADVSNNQVRRLARQVLYALERKGDQTRYEMAYQLLWSASHEASLSLVESMIKMDLGIAVLERIRRGAKRVEQASS